MVTLRVRCAAFPGGIRHDLTFTEHAPEGKLSFIDLLWAGWLLLTSFALGVFLAEGVDLLLGP